MLVQSFRRYANSDYTRYESKLTVRWTLRVYSNDYSLHKRPQSFDESRVCIKEVGGILVIVGEIGEIGRFLLANLG